MLDPLEEFENEHLKMMDGILHGVVFTDVTGKRIDPTKVKRGNMSDTFVAMDGLDVEPRETPQGTYVPVTDGWAVGFAFEQKGQPTQYIILNPSGDSDDGQPSVFVYEGEHNTIDNLVPAHFYNIGVKIDG